MDNSTQTKKTKRPVKAKTWGDEGFIGHLHYGCFDYEVRFVKEEKILDYYEGSTRDSSIQGIHGCVNCDEQIIFIKVEDSKQTQRLTLMHEIMHVVYLNNAVGNTDEGKAEVNIHDEDFVDTSAARILEIMRRNPDMMRWLLK